MIPFGLLALGAATLYNRRLEEDDERRGMERCANCRHFRGFGKKCKEGWTTPRTDVCWDEDERADWDD